MPQQPTQPTHRTALVPHEGSPGVGTAAIHSLYAEATLDSSRRLELRYVLRADLSRLRIVTRPQPTAGRADGLWHHTCFEAFLATAGLCSPDDPAPGSGYYEFNFSPAGQWAAYHFDTYRHGMKPVQLSPPVVEARTASQELELRAMLTLPETVIAGTARLGLTAVIEDAGGSLSYWSARHPPGKPDFHHHDNFLFEL